MKKRKEQRSDEPAYIDPHSEPAEKPPLLCVILYIACIVLGCAGDWRGMPGSLGTYMKAASIGAVALALYVFLKSGRLRGLKTLGKFAVLFIAPLLLTLLLSLLIWAINMEPLSAISRGATKLIFQVVNILSVLGGAYLFRERIVKYYFIGLIGGNALICLLTLPAYGPVAAVQSIITGLTGGETTGFMSAIEIHDITFAAGVMSMYYWTTQWRKKGAWIYGVVSLIFFVIGYKRIALIAYVLAIAVWFIVNILKRKTRVRLIYILSFSMVAIAFLYVICIKQGYFTMAMDYLGVDTMGRTKIYRYLSQFYEIDPTYMGYGFEYTTAMLRGMRDADTQVVHVTGIHNDILKLYIELGFWGFWAWMLFVYVYQTHWYMKHFGETAARLMLIINIYTFITYMTDNTTYYFWLSMALRVLMLGYTQSRNIASGLKREQKETGYISREDAMAFAGGGDDPWR